MIIDTNDDSYITKVYDIETDGDADFISYMSTLPLGTRAGNIIL